MFTMSQHQYAYPAVPAQRHYGSNLGTSSAFSPSANPDEDWTKISDLAERRRIQNRIAQRNYRKKLKRRLEDLERRAGNPDAPATPEKQGNASAKNVKRQQASTNKVQKSTPPPKPMTQAQFTPPMHHEDELLFQSTYDTRERSHTPPMFTYSTYPPPDEMLLPPYGSSQPYPTITSADAYPNYLAATVPVTLPSMTHFSDAIKRETYHSEDSLSPYMNYGFMPGMDVNAPAYDHSNPHTPPLSHSFDHSANCSDAGYEYPTTPLSMPGSPGMIQHH